MGGKRKERRKERRNEEKREGRVPRFLSCPFSCPSVRPSNRRADRHRHLPLSARPSVTCPASADSIKKDQARRTVSIRMKGFGSQPLRGHAPLCQHPLVPLPCRRPRSNSKMGRENRAMLFDLISDPHGRRRVPYPSLLRPRPRSSLENAPRDDLCIFDAPPRSA